MSQKKLPPFVALCLLASPLSAQSADISSYVSNEGKEIIVLKGDIAAGDADRLASIIRKANDAGRMVSGVRLNSPGGQIAEGVNLAELVKTAKIATVVARGAQCASACFIVFAAGNEKYVSYQAGVGVHGASDRDGQETTASNSATVAMARIVKELGVPPAIIGRMVVTPPSEVVWLTPDELQSMGTKMTGKPSQLPQGTNPTASSVGQPRQLPGGNASVNEEPKLTWKQFTDKAVDLSASQNEGKPRFVRGCQPEIKVCTTGIFYRDKNGRETNVKVVEDMNGKLVTRQICTFNEFSDIRTCLDWDTGNVHKDMKDEAGNWKAVSD